MILKLITITILLCINLQAHAQQVKDFFYLEAEDYEFPVYVRGNLDSNKLILFVQGGPGETSIDFARSDYPRWKNTLEQEFAIAYYDQRGLNQRVKNIDSAKITYDQYSRDIIALGVALKDKYKAELYIMGHSAGGKLVLNTLQQYSEEASFLHGAIVLNSPITTDYSPERWAHFRPLYLKNLAQEKLDAGIDTFYWQEAFNWITEIDSITTPEQAKQWNEYTDMAFEPAKRKVTPGMVLKVVFARPYNPIKYLKRKDDDRVGDLLWESGKDLRTFDGLESITFPILFLTGRYDDIGLPEENQRAHQIIPNSSLIILPDAGHQSFLDQPVLFNREISRFVNHN